jgi:hypothetical protein
VYDMVPAVRFDLISEKTGANTRLFLFSAKQVSTVPNLF